MPPDELDEIIDRMRRQDRRFFRWLCLQIAGSFLLIVCIHLLKYREYHDASKVCFAALLLWNLLFVFRKTYADI